MEKRGYLVLAAVNGKSGVEMCIKENPDLIIMDIQMPEMDGCEAVREIRKMGIKTPIIPLTAYALKETIASAFDAGVNGYLLKPAGSNEIYNEIDKFLK